MTTEVKEPGFVAETIPGLVRKKRSSKSVAAAVMQVDEPIEPLEVVPEPEVVESTCPQESEPVASLTYAEAHEGLMSCLIQAETSLRNIRAAADTYYVLCDYLNPSADIPLSPLLTNLLGSIDESTPTVLPELIDSQAKRVVDGWSSVQDTAAMAVGICHYLAQLNGGTEEKIEVL